jgi:hypothetical protein
MSRMGRCREKDTHHDAVLGQMHERLGAIRAWLRALTTLQAAQLGALVAILLRQ